MLIAADLTKLVARADDLPGPGQAAVERDSLEQPNDPNRKDRHGDNVRRVRRVDRDGVLGVVSPQGADIDVRRDLGVRCSGRDAEGNEQGQGQRRDAEDTQRPGAHDSALLELR